MRPLGGYVYELTEHERWWVATAGRAMTEFARHRGYKDRHGLAADDALRSSAQGIVGEYVLAQCLGVPLTHIFERDKAGDLGIDGLQVRCRSHWDWDLLIRPGEPSSHLYVLAVGGPRRVRLVGWLHGADAKRRTWLERYGGRPAAYFAPQRALEPFDAEKLAEYFGVAIRRHSSALGVA